MNYPLMSGELQARKCSIDRGSMSGRFLSGFVRSWALRYDCVEVEDGSDEDLKVTTLTFLAMDAL